MGEIETLEFKLIYNYGDLKKGSTYSLDDLLNEIDRLQDEVDRLETDKSELEERIEELEETNAISNNR